MKKVTSQEAADTIFNRLMFMKGQRPGTKAKIREFYVSRVLKAGCKLFFEDPFILDIEPPVTVIGSLNGRFYDLLCIFETYGYPPQHKFLFLGDIVGKGPQGLECFLLILCLKIKFPNYIYVIRGHAEIDFVNEKNGFKKEITSQYDIRIYNEFNSLFSFLPIAAVLGTEIFCVNSGIPVDNQTIDSLRSITRPYTITKSSSVYLMLTGQPDLKTDDWGEASNSDNLRFGFNSVTDFLTLNHYDLIIRSHAIVDEGYEFTFEGDPKFLTLSSIPSYHGKEEKNGCILIIDDTLKIVFSPVKPLPYIYRDYYGIKDPLIQLTDPIRTCYGKH